MDPALASLSTSSKHSIYHCFKLYSNNINTYVSLHECFIHFMVIVLNRIKKGGGNSNSISELKEIFTSPIIPGLLKTLHIQYIVFLRALSQERANVIPFISFSFLQTSQSCFESRIKKAKGNHWRI